MVSHFTMYLVALATLCLGVAFGKWIGDDGVVPKEMYLLLAVASLLVGAIAYFTGVA